MVIAACGISIVSISVIAIFVIAVSYVAISGVATSVVAVFISAVSGVSACWIFGGVVCWLLLLLLRWFLLLGRSTTPANVLGDFVSWAFRRWICHCMFVCIRRTEPEFERPGVVRECDNLAT